MSVEGEFFLGAGVFIVLFSPWRDPRVVGMVHFSCCSRGKRPKSDRNLLAEVPDIIARFHNLANEEGRERTEQSFFVPKKEIVNNGYDLSINKYKETEYEVVEYPSTDELLTQIEELETKINAGIKELRRIL